MEADQIMRASLNDIVFEGRNKSYGAYALRAKYEKHLIRATIVAVSLFLLAIFAPAIIKALTPEEEVEAVAVKEITYTQLAEPPPMDDTPPPPPPPDMPPPEVKQLKFTPPKIVEDDKIVEPPPTINEMKTAVITSGPSTEGAEIKEEAPPVVINQVIEEEDNTIYTGMENKPFFPGGDEGMMNFIRKNIKYPQSAIAAGLEGKVFLSFVVDKQGQVTNVTIMKGVASSLDQEAIRVVKLLKGFKPAEQNGRPVKFQYVVPVSFTLQ